MSARRRTRRDRVPPPAGPPPPYAVGEDYRSAPPPGRSPDAPGQGRASPYRALQHGATTRVLTASWFGSAGRRGRHVAGRSAALPAASRRRWVPTTRRGWVVGGVAVTWLVLGAGAVLTWLVALLLRAVAGDADAAARVVALLVAGAAATALLTRRARRRAGHRTVRGAPARARRSSR